MKKMTKAEIREFNSKVEYNESVASWVVDLISCAILAHLQKPVFPFITFCYKISLLYLCLSKVI